MPPLCPITMRGKQALAAALRAGGASSSSSRDVHVPLHIRLQEEYERVTGDRGRLQENRGGYVCPGYPQCENMDCDCAGPQSEEEQEEGGAADWKEDLLNWETMGDDPPETEAADVKESDEEDREKGKEEEPCICCLCMSEKTFNLYINAKEKEERGKGAGTTGARPKPSSKRWKMLVRSNFPRRPQPRENNVRPVNKYDFVFLPDAVKGFRVRKGA